MSEAFAQLDDEALRYMRALEALGPQDYRRLSVHQARAVLSDAAWPLPPTAEPVEICAERDVRGILYAPAHAAERAGLMLYLHGGGFVMGDASCCTALCERVAAEARCYVLSLEYRLAPEARFPSAVDDCVLALRWAVEHAADGGWDATRLAIAGQSAGGNLAAVTAQAWRGQAPPLRFQLLICPLTDFRSGVHASRERLAHNVVLSAEAIAWFESRYLRRPADRDDPRASPLLAADLSGLPAAHVIVAAGDPLCDEGEAYAHALRAAGVPTQLERYPSVHGFVEFWTELHQGALALQSTVRSLRAALGGKA